MKVFEEVFLPRAARVLETNQQMQFVLFAEDDSTLHKKITAAEVNDALGNAQSKVAVWLGYYILRGEPTGAQLVGFSREAVKSFQNYLKDIHRRDHSHLHGFDTFLRNLISQGLVRLVQKTVAYQRGHKLQKRH